MSSWLLLIAFVGLVETFEDDFLKEYISSKLDKSVSPCDDFYAHVCPYGLPESETVREKVSVQYLDILKTFVGPNPPKGDPHESNLYTDLLASCDGGEGEAIVRKIAVSVVPSLKGDDFASNLSCQEMASMALNLYPVKLRQYIVFLKYGALHMEFAATEYAKFLDNQAQSIFNILKMTTAQLLKETPWLTNKNGTGLYLDFLEKEINLFSITQNDFLLGKMLHRFLLTEAMKCKEKFATKMKTRENGNSRLSLVNMTYTCLLYGIDFVLETSAENSNHEESFLSQLKKVTKKIFQNLAETIIFNAINDEGLVVLGRPLEMVLKKQGNLARNFGSLGFTIGHEIMHSLFHSPSHDTMQISKFWTNTSECVSKQFSSTCAEYLKDQCFSGTPLHLEEDGADLAGSRLAFAAFKSIQKNLKEPSDIEGITVEQMVFYANTATFCENGKSRFMMTDDTHSQEYVRQNAVMSQMEEWREAFNCGADSRMLRSKTEHCSVYGSDAAQTFL